jgi:FAD/FMN-containing dehydrogenase
MHNISFLATGGRHGYGTSLGKMHDGLAIDLSQLNTVVVNQSAATLTIGGGVRFRDIVDPVYEAGFQIRQFPTHHSTLSDSLLTVR